MIDTFCLGSNNIWREGQANNIHTFLDSFFGLENIFLITEAPKGLTAKYMDYGSREYGFWILDLSTSKTKKFLKIKLIDRLII
jgi:hypothetical protein